jgi:hypothetical protein
MLGIRLDIAVSCLEAPENWMLRGHLDGNGCKKQWIFSFSFQKGCDGHKDRECMVIGASGGARCGWEQLAYKWLSRRFSVCANRAER